MTMLTTDQLRRELHRHVGFDGAVPAHIGELLAADGPWDGRLWEVFEVFAADRERMAYLAGGLLPDEVATWVELWADTELGVDQITRIIEAGGYAPDPFVALARHGLLDPVLETGDGKIRHVEGEPVGAWVSDQFGASGDDDLVRWARQVSG